MAHASDQRRKRHHSRTEKSCSRVNLMQQICGGSALKGEVKIGGSKNAALVLMAASLLTHEPTVSRLFSYSHMHSATVSQIMRFAFMASNR
eukprot:scaffold537863_cov29-Prasinocladus_malaysianus.AAC.2